MHAARLRGLVAEDASRPGRRKPGPATAARKLVLACLAQIEPPGQSGVGDDHTGRPRAKEAKPASPPLMVGGRQGASHAGRLLLNPEGPPRGFSPGRWRVQAEPLDSQGSRPTLHATADGLSRGAAEQKNPPLHLNQLYRVPRDLHVQGSEGVGDRQMSKDKGSGRWATPQAGHVHGSRHHEPAGSLHEVPQSDPCRGSGIQGPGDDSGSMRGRAAPVPHLKDDPGLHPRRALLAPGSRLQRQGLPEVPEVATKCLVLGPPGGPQGPLTKREKDVSRCPNIPEGLPA